LLAFGDRRHLLAKYLVTPSGTKFALLGFQAGDLGD
jgi:hypothetical protein